MGNNQSLLKDHCGVWSFIQQNQKAVISEIIDSIIEDEEIEDEGGIKKRRRVKCKSRDDWWSTDWGLMLLNPNIRDINTHEGKEFRRRYRLPGAVYETINILLLHTNFKCFLNQVIFFWTGWFLNVKKLTFLIQS